MFGTKYTYPPGNIHLIPNKDKYLPNKKAGAFLPPYFLTKSGAPVR